jgi:hypothetical protein
MIQTAKLSYYFITVKPKDGKTLTAVRELKEDNIDHLFNLYEMKASGVYRELDHFNLVLLSRYSKEVIEYEKRKNTYGQPPEPDIIPYSKSKKESKDIGPTLLERMSKPETSISGRN